MAETSDYDPGAWRGHDFTSARAQYDAYAGRSYSVAKATKTKVSDLIPKKLKTSSPNPLIIACDVTGSMGDRPATIFSKCPYLDIEGKEYLGPDMEISFGAIGDVGFDNYFLQIREFSKELKLKDELTKLVIEGGGGANKTESYELMALYLSRNLEVEEKVRPIILFIGDEGYKNTIYKEDAEKIFVSLEENSVDSYKVFKELMEKASVYMIRSPYGDKYDEKDIHSQWVNLLGEERIAMLPDASRIVDVIFGILAKETNKIDYFKAELEGRQTQNQVDTVYQSLKTVHALPLSPKDESKSRMLLAPPNVKKTKSLI